jgi:hypothetical protein
MLTYLYLWYLIEFFLEWCAFQTNVVEKIKTLILWLLTFSFPENLAIYELMCKNMVEPYRPQITI